MVRFLPIQTDLNITVVFVTHDQEEARLLHQWGAKEVLITHNTEVLDYIREFYRP